MITIIEKLSEKLPCKTSLFFTLGFYNPQLFGMLIQTSVCNFNKTTKEFEFPISSLSFLVCSLTKYDEVKFIPFHSKVKNIKQYCTKEDFSVNLYQHQIDGVNYGLNKKGWMLLDQQGLGKTLTMISLAEKLKEKEDIEHCLIICGVNSLKYNWVREIETFSNLTYTVLGQKISKNGKISFETVEERCKQLKNGVDEFFVITNVETLQNSKFAESFNKSKSKFGLVVLDEAHRCKNPSSKSAKTLLKLKAERCVALTGTVIMNDPENAYLPLKWTGNTKANYSKFKSVYNVYGGFGGVQVVGHKNLEVLKELIDSCSLRRLAKDVLDLPDKIYYKEYVELLPQQRALYEEVAEGITAELDMLDKEKKLNLMQEITANMRLRQISASPSILSTTVQQSAKLDRLEHLLEDITAQGDKAVVFCTFKGTAYEAVKRLEKHNPLLCTGDQSDDEITARKDLFQNNKENKVMVCTWQKMGTGHTLTSANYAIFVDTPFTDADFQQASDRIYRIGQDKKVFIITLIAKDTYDERVQEIIDRKERLSNYLVDDGEMSLVNILEDYDG